MSTWFLIFRSLFRHRDDCQFCLGIKGGVPGNENREPGGIVVCDYCTALLLDIEVGEAGQDYSGLPTAKGWTDPSWPEKKSQGKSEQGSAGTRDQSQPSPDTNPPDKGATPAPTSDKKV